MTVCHRILKSTEAGPWLLRVMRPVWGMVSASRRSRSPYLNHQTACSHLFRAPCPTRAGYAHKGADGMLHFSGLVATPDGKQIMRASRVVPFTEADAVKCGEEAGKELKANGPKELFMY